METHTTSPGETYNLVDLTAEPANRRGEKVADAANSDRATSPPAKTSDSNGHHKKNATGGNGRASEGAEAPSESEKAAPAEKRGSGGYKLRKRSGGWTWRLEVPAWAVSIVGHICVLSVMAAYGISSTIHQETNLDAAPFDPSLAEGQVEELTPILAEPSAEPRTDAIQDDHAVTPGPATGLATVGSGAPSATPRVSSSGRSGARNMLPDIQALAPASPLAMLPVNPGRDLGGGGLIRGDVTMRTQDVGEALDQLAREILHHLASHKLIVVWLFDESSSMRDDQQAIRDKFARVANELKIDEGKRNPDALLHSIVGFGNAIDFEQRKPTANIDSIGQAIGRLKIDETGVEKTFQAIQAVIAEYGRFITKERRLLIVLVTDESGDDGDYMEEARQLALGRGVPIYVIGRQSMFGKDSVVLPYKDPVTGDMYYPSIRRGPESADLEAFQWDGLHPRWDEQPSGFAPYELARMTEDTGGVYFLLPSEEYLRATQREKAYSMSTLKEYVPDYQSRISYLDRRMKSPVRSMIFEIVKDSQKIPTRIDFPIEAPGFLEAADMAAGEAKAKLATLLAIEQRLRDPKMLNLRDREPEKRWQASFDLTLAQVVAYQVKTYEYIACLAELVQKYQSGKPPQPSKMPTKDLVVNWRLGHSKEPKAPKGQTEKKYAEALALMKKVIERHPNTPWADLAQDEINRGFSVGWGEHSTTSQYAERMKLVPKY